MNRTITIHIQGAELPEDVNSLLFSKRPGEYSILTNTKKTEKEQAANFLHECLHIYHEDMETENPADADQLERIRHKELLSLLEMLTGGELGF